MHGSKLMLFSCRKYFILDRPSRKLPSALSKNYVSIVICFFINNLYLFCIKQANKICTLLSSHLLALTGFEINEKIQLHFAITYENLVALSQILVAKSPRCIVLSAV